MSRVSSEKEMQVYDEIGEESEKRGINWMMISFAIIIATLLLGVLALTVLPKNVFNFTKTNVVSNTAANPK